MAKERWKPIKNFESRYAISNMAQVKNIQTKKILRPFFASSGRNNLAVSLTIAGAGHSYSLPKLMAETWLGPCPKGKRLGFRDGDNTNCIQSNLWYTAYKKEKFTFSPDAIFLSRDEVIASIWNNLIPDTQKLLKKYNLLDSQKQGEYGLRSRYEAEGVQHDG